MAEEPYCDFFTKEAMFLQQVIHVMDHGIAGKNLEELQEQNHELYQDILPENYENSYGMLMPNILIATENSEKYLPFFIQNFMARLLMRLKKKHGILRLYLNCFWKSILHLRRKKFLLRNR